MERPLGIGIDLGGTRIKGAAFDLDAGRSLAQRLLPTHDGEFETDGTPRFVTGARTIVEDFTAEFGQPPAAVGISAPGLASPDHSHITCLPVKMQGLVGLRWRDSLGLPPSTPCAVLNDAHAALMGEVWLGSAAGHDDVVFLTLGTGVGGAILSGGRLLTGPTGRAGHLGHLSLDPDGPPDICRTPGSIEDAIGNATVGARSGGRFSSTQELLDAVDSGDPEATAVWEKSVRALGATVVGLINALDPTVVVMGGGISNAGIRLTAPLEAYLDAHEWRPNEHRVPVAIASLGEWAGAAGAAHFAHTRTPPSGSLT